MTEAFSDFLIKKRPHDFEYQPWDKAKDKWEEVSNSGEKMGLEWDQKNHRAGGQELRLDPKASGPGSRGKRI